VVQDLKHVTWYGLDGTIRRQEPIGKFTVDPLASSGDASLPSPTDPNLLLVSCGVPPTPADTQWAHDTGAALFLYDAASGTNFRLKPPAFVRGPGLVPGRPAHLLPECPKARRRPHTISTASMPTAPADRIARGLHPA
jgi:hypothetical protein